MKNEPDIPPRDPVEDSLDELLRSARWPDDAADPLNALLRVAQWPEPVGSSLPDVRRIGRRRKWTTVVAAVGTAAAAVLLVVMAIRAARDVGDKPADGSRLAKAPPAISAVGDQPKTVSPALLPLEVRLRMIMEQVRERSALEDEAIDRLVARRVVEPDGDLEELVQPLLAQRAEFEQRLLGRFNTFLGERETAAVELLGCLGSEASLPLVLRERLKPSTHAAAIRALLQLADTETLAQLERQEMDAGMREEIAAALRSPDDNQTTASTLIFAEGDQSCLEFRPDYSQRADLF
jgi:hypothetical protein